MASESSPLQTTLLLSFPRELSPEQLVDALRGLHGLLPPRWRRLLGTPSVSLEVAASRHGIWHFLTLPGARASFVSGQLRAALPGLRVSPAEGTLGAEFDLARELVPSGPGRLRVQATEPTNRGILAALQPLAGTDSIVVQWVLTPAPATSWPRPMLPFPREEFQTSADRRREPAFRAVARVGVRSGHPAHLIARVLGALGASGSVDRSLRRRLLPSALVADGLRGRRPVGLFSGPALDADELASALGVPLGDSALPGLSLVGARDLPPAPAVGRSGRILGDARGGRIVALDVAESRKGLLLTAPTGGGKSTVLENLCAQDFAANRAVIVIESKGDLISALSDLVPKERTSDVVVFDPADSHPVGFNLLAGGSEAADLITDHVVSQFKSLYTAYLGPRSEMLLRAALLTLSAQATPYTICEVIPLLSEPAFRRRLVGTLDDHVLQGIWSWFEEQTPAAQAEMVAPLTNKLAAFTLRRQVRAVVGQATGSLDFERAMRERQIVLVSLAKGTMGEDAASLLGSVLLARLWAGVQARAAMRPEARPFVSVVLDEAQDFLRLPVALGDAVAQSRGLGVGWTISHQNLGQLSTELRRAVLANLRTKMVFQTTADDAAIFAREFAPHLSTADLQGLGPYEAYAAVSTGASVAPPALITTRPPPTRAGLESVVRERSRARHGADPATTDRALRARLERRPRQSPVGSKRRT